MLNRAVLIGNVVVLLAVYVFFTKAREPQALSLTVQPTHATLDSGSATAALHVQLFNRWWASAFVRSADIGPDIYLDRWLGGRWLLHRRIPLVTDQRSGFILLPRRGSLPLPQGDQLQYTIGVRQPGRYRLRAYGASSARGPVGVVLSSPFTVMSPRPPATSPGS